MDFSHLTIIGGGNLGTAIAVGLRKNNAFDEVGITVTKRDISGIAHLNEMNVDTTSDNISAAAKGEVIILAVQPGQIRKVLDEIKNVITNISSCAIAHSNRNMRFSQFFRQK